MPAGRGLADVHDADAHAGDVDLGALGQLVKAAGLLHVAVHGGDGRKAAQHGQDVEGGEIAGVHDVVCAFGSLQHGSRQLTLVALDIDGVKQVNETHGHLTGDQVIKEMARRTLLRIDRFEVLCRYEGTQFLLLLPEGDSAQALTRAEELRHAICTEPVRCEDEIVTITVSAGVATLDNEADAPGLIEAFAQAAPKRALFALFTDLDNPADLEQLAGMRACSRAATSRCA